MCTKHSLEITCHFLQDLNGFVFMISFIGSQAWAVGINMVGESGVPQRVRITVTTGKTQSHGGTGS